jgi:hypothetical protein
LVPRLLHDDRFVRWPEPRVTNEDSPSTRRTIATETVERIRQLSDDGLALRAIGREIGVSHEAVRTLLKL